MDFGIGLPATIPGIPGRLVLDWARTAPHAVAGFEAAGCDELILFRGNRASDGSR